MDSDKSEHYNSITVLYRQMNKWYYYGNNSDTDTRNPEIELEENINFFLSKNIQFVRIDENHIVNLNHLEDYSLKGSEGFLIVSKMRYNIESDFITKIREARKEFQNSIDAAVLPSSMKASWLHKIKATQPNKSVNAFIDAENIMYMLRIRSRTYIYYKDNKKRHFYETLKYFEKNLDTTIPLVRVNRNCVINLKYVTAYKVFTQPKMGEVNIDNYLFKISRRQLGVFKKRVKDCLLIFAIQEIIE